MSDIDESSENEQQPEKCKGKDEEDVDKVSLGDPTEFEELDKEASDSVHEEKNGESDHEDDAEGETRHSSNLELEGLPKYYSFGQLKKLVNETLQLKATRFKAFGKVKNYVLMSFEGESARDRAISTLTGYEWKGSTFKAKVPDPNRDPLALTKIDSINISPSLKDLPMDDKIVKALSPLQELSYEEQLKKKETLALSVLRKYGNELSQLNPELHEWVTWHKLRRRGQICEVDAIVASAVVDGYRNICKFIIGFDSSETKVPAIGYRMCDYTEGALFIAPITKLKDISEPVKKLVKHIEDYLKNCPFHPYDPLTRQGFWRQLIIRSTNNSDVMVIIQVHPQQHSDDEIKEAQNDVVQYLTIGDGKDCDITSIFFQRNSGYKESEDGEDLEHAYGTYHLTETILGTDYKVAPNCHLKCNTAAAEELYKKVEELAEIDATSVLLDVCCSIGILGTIIGKGAYKVIGVDKEPNAVQNARENAESQGMANGVFYCGKAEIYTDKMVERAETMSCIAIVNSPKSGMQGSVINTLRKFENLEKLIYIACDPQAIDANFQALGRPKSKNYKGSYFVPIRAVPVDLYPHTSHFELVVVFERFDDCKWRRIMDGNPRPKDQAYFDRIPLPQYEPARQKKFYEDHIPEPEDDSDIWMPDYPLQSPFEPMPKRPRGGFFGGGGRGWDRDLEQFYGGGRGGGREYNPYFGGGMRGGRGFDPYFAGGNRMGRMGIDPYMFGPRGRGRGGFDTFYGGGSRGGGAFWRGPREQRYQSGLNQNYGLNYLYDY